MHRDFRHGIFTALLLLALAGAASAAGDARRASGFGAVAVPQPAKPAAAEQCVEPVEVMRRDHMKFLDHQRDEAVLDGKRDGRYSLVGCIDCHNPADDAAVVRYEDPGHFCADCHRYASVRIDCFECHADRGLRRTRQGGLDAPAWADRRALTASTAGAGASRVD